MFTRPVGPLQERRWFVSESEAAESKPPKSPEEPGDEAPSGKKRRVAAVVGLVLLEVIRVRDLPTEILSSEDPSRTMPRRLGLSEAVDLQIRRFRDMTRRKDRLTDEEARDLFHLVLRRGDSEEVCFQAGELLVGKDSRKKGLHGAYPRKVLLTLARRRVRRRLKALLGREVGAFRRGGFTLEARGHFFLDMDPGGDACALLTGFLQTILARYLGDGVKVSHSLCEARKDDLCRWTMAVPED